MECNSLWNGLNLFKLGIELKVLLSFRDAKPDHPDYLVVTDKLDRQVKDCKDHLDFQVKDYKDHLDYLVVTDKLDLQVKDYKDHLVFQVKVFKVNLEEMEKKVKQVSKD